MSTILEQLRERAAKGFSPHPDPDAFRTDKGEHVEESRVDRLKQAFVAADDGLCGYFGLDRGDCDWKPCPVCDELEAKVRNNIEAVDEYCRAADDFLAGES